MDLAGRPDFVSNPGGFPLLFERRFLLKLRVLDLPKSPLDLSPREMYVGNRCASSVAMVFPPLVVNIEATELPVDAVDAATTFPILPIAWSACAAASQADEVSFTLLATKSRNAHFGCSNKQTL